MKIFRKGLIYCPDGTLPWAKTHAMNPTVEIVSENVIRVYFSSLDENNVGRIGYVDLNANNPKEILYLTKEPILQTGLKGTFDHNGMVPSSIVVDGSRKYLYYYGFQLVKDIRFLIFSGLAISEDEGKTFLRFENVPVLDRNNVDLYVRSLPHVIKTEKTWKVWYSGVNEWTQILGKELPVGNIRYTESADGMHFDKEKIVTCLEPNQDEFSLSRAFVFKQNDKWNMLFSRRMRNNDLYQLGFASSTDGIVWTRDDEKLKIEPSLDAWDNEMICYSSLISIQNKNYLFYNGNKFGATGFGYAEVEF